MVVFVPSGISAAAITAASFVADALFASTPSPFGASLTFDVQLPMVGNVPQGTHTRVRADPDLRILERGRQREAAVRAPEKKCSPCVRTVLTVSKNAANV